MDILIFNEFFDFENLFNKQFDKTLLFLAYIIVSILLKVFTLKYMM